MIALTMPLRTPRRLAWFLLCACLLAAGSPARAEDDAARAQRFDGLIESLNAGSDRRARVLEVIYNELRGTNTREMQDTLRGALSRRNTLILQGVVEAMAMLGDAQDVANLEALLATCPLMEVKTIVIRLLPAFCLGNSERARFNYIRYAAGYERVAGANVLPPLRRPPLTRRGRFESALELVRSQVTRCIARQFDPAGAAIQYLDDRLYGAAARTTVTHYVGNSLGADPTLWSRIWTAQGDDAEFVVPDEVEEIRLASLQSLSDMGAEGLPEIIDALRRMAGSGAVLRQAAFDTMGVMCRVAFRENAMLAGMEFGAEDAVEAENWRARRYASNINLAVTAAETARQTLFSPDFDPSVFLSAAAALAGALSYPPAFPDPEGELAAARAGGLEGLEQLLLMPDLSRQKRSAVILALGEIGSVRGVEAIVRIIASPYSSPDFGPDGARIAESAVDALRNAAIGGQEGQGAARDALLSLLADVRVYPPLRADALPVGLAHMALWRLQRLAKSNDTSFDAGLWRPRLGW